jgi:hypothetical protein
VLRARRGSGSRRSGLRASRRRASGGCASSCRARPRPSAGWRTSCSAISSKACSTRCCPPCRRREGARSKSRCSWRSFRAVGRPADARRRGPYGPARTGGKDAGPARRRRRPVARPGRPLSVGALHRLLHDRLGRPFARQTLLRIHETSGGNPFFALEQPGLSPKTSTRCSHFRFPRRSRSTCVRDSRVSLPLRVRCPSSRRRWRTVGVAPRAARRRARRTRSGNPRARDRA